MKDRIFSEEPISDEIVDNSSSMPSPDDAGESDQIDEDVYSKGGTKLDSFYAVAPSPSLRNYPNCGKLYPVGKSLNKCPSCGERIGKKGRGCSFAVFLIIIASILEFIVLQV